jgi:hypothetical protein
MTMRKQIIWRCTQGTVVLQYLCDQILYVISYL